MIRDGVFDGATGGVSKPLDEKAVRCCDRWRLKSLSLVLSLLFNPALSQPNLVRAEAVPPISRGQTGLPGTGPAPTPIHGFGNCQSLRTTPSLARKTHSRPPRQSSRSALRCSTVIMVVLAAESGWGLWLLVLQGGWGFYLALAATISAS